MITLECLEFLPINNSGWTSDKKRFGTTITEVHGGNTTGKTPLLKGVAYCLGYPAEMAAEVKAHCKSIKLTLKLNLETILIERFLNEDYKITITENQETTEYLNENDMSEKMFQLLGIEKPLLTQKITNNSAVLYISNLYPAFWVDQDLGWSNIYNPLPTKNFIKSQRQEITRLLLNLSSKYPFKDNSDKKNFKIDLATTEQEIEIKKRLMKELGIKNTSFDENHLKNLDDERKRLRGKIIDMTNDLKKLEFGEYRVDEEAKRIDLKISEISSRSDLLKARERRLLSELNDLEAEISILSDNANVAEMFKSFCGSDKCSIFNKDGFGKKLLYLKDQKKDMNIVLSELTEEISKLEEKINHEKDRRFTYSTTKSKDAKSNAVVENLLTASQQLSEEAHKIDLEIITFTENLKISKQLSALLTKRESLSSKIKELTGKSGKTKQENNLIEAIQTLQTTLKEWLFVIGAKYNSVVVTDKFEIEIDGNIFKEGSEESGSERQRIVLAYHAALLETSFVLDGCHPGLLIFDGIIQHEISLNDIRAYLQKIVDIKAKYNKSLQIIFSITAEDFNLGNMKDKVTWKPEKIVNGKKWFLGP